MRFRASSAFPPSNLGWETGTSGVEGIGSIAFVLAIECSFRSTARGTPAGDFFSKCREADSGSALEDKNAYIGIKFASLVMHAALAER